MDRKWYKLSAAAAAAGLNVGTVRGWIGKGWLYPEEMKLAYTAGATHYIDQFGVRRLAIMRELLAFGIPGARAFRASMAFLDVGDFRFNIGGETLDQRMLATAVPPRAPGELYPDGLTFLFCPPGEEGGRVLNLRPGEMLLDRLTAEGPRSAVIINLNRLVEEIDSNLQPWRPQRRGNSSRKPRAESGDSGDLPPNDFGDSAVNSGPSSRCA